MDVAHRNTFIVFNVLNDWIILHALFWCITSSEDVKKYCIYHFFSVANVLNEWITINVVYVWATCSELTDVCPECSVRTMVDICNSVVFLKLFILGDIFEGSELQVTLCSGK